MKMSDDDKKTHMLARNAAICDLYLSGATLAACGKRFGLKRQRIKQIVQEAGIWREPIPHIPDGRDEFLGINISPEDKEALKAEAARTNTSMSALTSDWIRQKLAELHGETEPSEPREEAI
jgi:hypothetical protein